MKKFFTVLLWLGLAASLIALVSVAGDRTALREEARKGKQKYEALKTMYDREKAEWLEASDRLTADNAALTLEKQSLAAALAELGLEGEGQEAFNPGTGESDEQPEETPEPIKKNPFRSAPRPVLPDRPVAVCD